MFDYKDRAMRAEFILKSLRKEDVYTLQGREYTGLELTNEIVAGTLLGRSLVAVGGIVLAGLTKPGSDVPKCQTV